MEDIVISKIYAYVADAFDARVILTALVGEENTIPAL